MTLLLGTSPSPLPITPIFLPSGPSPRAVARGDGPLSPVQFRSNDVIFFTAPMTAGDVLTCWTVGAHRAPLQFFERHLAGGSMALLRNSAAASGDVMNLIRSRATASFFETLRTATPKWPYSIRSGGKGPR